MAVARRAVDAGSKELELGALAWPAGNIGFDRARPWNVIPRRL